MARRALPLAVLVILLLAAACSSAPGPSDAQASNPSPFPYTTAPPASPPARAVTSVTGRNLPAPPPGKYKQAPPMAIDQNKTYAATIETAKGPVKLELFAKDAPVTVNNFVFLANEGFYDGLTFHRVIPGFVAQGGDPKGDGTGGPGYYIPNETANNPHKHEAFALAMANAGPDTNGCQFYITLAAQPQLDGQYTVFGRVVEGQDVILAITPRDPQTNRNAPPGDKIVKIRAEAAG